MLWTQQMAPHFLLHYKDDSWLSSMLQRFSIGNLPETEDEYLPDLMQSPQHPLFTDKDPFFSGEDPKSSPPKQTCLSWQPQLLTYCI